MVIQVEPEELLDTKIQKHKMESKKYIVFKNHVREIKEQPEEVKILKDLNEEKHEKYNKNEVHKQSSSSSEDDQINTVIATKDLEELKTVYKKCKSILNKIETKYGHLLDLNDEDEYRYPKRKRVSLNDNFQHKCICTPNKKTIFTEDGQQVSQTDIISESHICVSNNKYQNTYESIQVDYENEYTILPDNIQELTKILKDSEITRNFRNRVIEKIRYLRYENLNEIKYKKESLVKKLKSNPEEIIDFKGTNISSLPGYPTT
ncbi:unnamed protein product, partial [Brenthis ino]